MRSDRCVLLADDEPNDLFFFTHAFEQARILNPIKTVSDGQQVINYLSGESEFSDRQRFPLPILLVLDVKMPRKSGLDVLQWLQEQQSLRSIPTVMLSSSAHPDDVEKAYQLGANSFIVKPQGVAARIELAKLINSYWLTLNELPKICR